LLSAFATGDLPKLLPGNTKALAHFAG